MDFLIGAWENRVCTPGTRYHSKKTPMRRELRVFPGKMPDISKHCPRSGDRHTIPNLFYFPKPGLSSTFAQKLPILSPKLCHAYQTAQRAEPSACLAGLRLNNTIGPSRPGAGSVVHRSGFGDVGATIGRPFRGSGKLGFSGQWPEPNSCLTGGE